MRYTKQEHGYISAFVCLGSNADNAETMLSTACQALACLDGIQLKRLSSMYETEPQGYAQQAWFCNQVVELEIETEAGWKPDALLERFLRVESMMGRKRSNDPALRYGPRAIDIDLLLFGDVVRQEQDCILPHPRMTERAFVLVPLAEIAPTLCIYGRCVQDWLADIVYRREGYRIFQ